MKSSFLRLASDAPARQRLRNGEVLMTPATALQIAPSVIIPGGQIQHWLGAMYLPKTTLAVARPRLQDYDRRSLYMSPEITASHLLSRHGNNFHVYLKLNEKSLISGVFDVNLNIAYQSVGSNGLLISSRSESITDVSHDRGILWGLNHYWRILEADGGLYVECEALVLSRNVPGGIQLLAGPIISQSARKTLFSTLNSTRRLISSPNTATN